MASRAFTIRPLTDDGTVTPTSFVWTAENGAMPRGLMALPVTAAIKKRTQYPGNEGRPTEQRLGWELEDGWTVSGEWDRRRMGAGIPESTKLAMEALVKANQRVSIQLDGDRIIGFIDKVAPVVTPYGFSYTLTISPHGQTSGRAPVPGGLLGQAAVRSPDEYYSDTAASVLSAIDRHGSATSWAFAGSYHADLGDSLSDLAATMTSISTTLASRENTQATPVEVVRVAASLFAKVRTDAAVVAAVLDDADSTAVVAWDSPMGVLRFESWSRGVASDMRATQWKAHEATLALGRQADPSILALYKPRKNESIMAIARRYYGDPLLWREIHSRNRLEYTNFQGTETIVIPVLG